MTVATKAVVIDNGSASVSSSFVTFTPETPLLIQINFNPHMDKQLHPL